MSNSIEKVVVFERATGRVVSSGTTQCPETLITDVLDVLVGEQADPGMSYVESGIVVSIPDKEFLFQTFDYTTKQWIDPRTPATEWIVVRAERVKRLTASDWTQLPDVPAATQAVWRPSRQALRDITTQADPFNISWPVAP